jgi:glycosyltransferase involved in cell wall biosynthesis
MRIALIVPGGVDPSAKVRVIPVLLALIERLTKRHQVLVVAVHQEPQPSAYDLLGAHVVNLGALPKGRLRNWGVRLRQFLAALKSYGGNFDVIHAVWAHPCGSLAVAAAAWLDVPVVVSIGGGELAGLPEIDYGGQLKLRTRMAISTAVRRATVVSAPSAFTLRPLRKLRPDALWLPLGAANAFFQDPRARPSGREVRLLQVAGLNPVKDQSTLMKAMRRVLDVRPDISLDLIGVDTLGGEMQRLAASLGISEGVRFHGPLPVDALLPFYRRADVYVQSSLHESMGAAVLEASAAGVPVVGTAVGLVAEMSPHSALAVPTRDADALARAILSLCDGEEERLRLGRAARAFAHAFSADWSASVLEEVYRRASRDRTPFGLDTTQIKIELADRSFH